VPEHESGRHVGREGGVVTSPDDAVFGDRARLAQKLERVSFALDQSEVTRQLLARDLVRQTDEARHYRLERDELETKVGDLLGELADVKDERDVALSERDSARAAASFQRTRL
jgi:hypothetical protein